MTWRLAKLDFMRKNWIRLNGIEQLFANCRISHPGSWPSEQPSERPSERPNEQRFVFGRNLQPHWNFTSLHTDQ